MTDAIKAELVNCQKHLIDAQKRIESALQCEPDATRADWVRTATHAISAAERSAVEALGAHVGAFCWRCKENP